VVDPKRIIRKNVCRRRRRGTAGRWSPPPPNKYFFLASTLYHGGIRSHNPYAPINSPRQYYLHTYVGHSAVGARLFFLSNSAYSCQSGQEQKCFFFHIIQVPGFLVQRCAGDRNVFVHNTYFLHRYIHSCVLLEFHGPSLGDVHLTSKLCWLRSSKAIRSMFYLVVPT
jgi:hypothetical protein